MNTVYDFTVKNINGEVIKLSKYKDDVLLIVNVASECGFTKQYDGLQSLYEKYKDKNFKVLAFPCNQFGGQEPGSDEEIKNFCTSKFNVTFPIFSKIDVNGDNAHPLFEFLKTQSPGVLGSQAIKWNFTKFLVGSSGNVVNRFAPTKKPAEIQPEIEALL